MPSSEIRTADGLMKNPRTELGGSAQIKTTIDCSGVVPAAHRAYQRLRNFLWETMVKYNFKQFIQAVSEVAVASNARD
jgi:hypothetical protein